MFIQVGDVEPHTSNMFSQNDPSFKDTHKYSFQNQVLPQMHLRPIVRWRVQSSLPPALENTSLGLSPIFH